MISEDYVHHVKEVMVSSGSDAGCGGWNLCCADSAAPGVEQEAKK